VPAQAQSAPAEVFTSNAGTSKDRRELDSINLESEWALNLYIMAWVNLAGATVATSLTTLVMESDATTCVEDCSSGVLFLLGGVMPASVVGLALLVPAILLDGDSRSRAHARRQRLSRATLSVGPGGISIAGHF
jgi:hypothetical protein